MAGRSFLDSPFSGLTAAQSKARIVTVLKEQAGNMRQAAVELGLSRETLRTYVRNLGLAAELERIRGRAR
jgi:transcriptional regulator of acetoin/glycerol metabolism